MKNIRKPVSKLLIEQIGKSKRFIQFIRYLQFTVDVFRGKERYVANEVILNNERLGTDYGGFCICPDRISPDSVVYSIGVGQDISFDLALIKNYGCNVFAFDPTPKSIDWLKQQTLPENFKFFPFALANYDGKAQFFPPQNPNFVSHRLIRKSGTVSRAIEIEVRRISTLMEMLGHDSIELLKMDIEGAEYSVIPDIEKSNVTIGQICLEFHHNFPSWTIQDTLLSLKILNKMGFKLFYQDRLGGNTYSLIHTQSLSPQ